MLELDIIVEVSQCWGGSVGLRRLLLWSTRPGIAVRRLKEATSTLIHNTVEEIMNTVLSNKFRPFFVVDNKLALR